MADPVLSEIVAGINSGDLFPPVHAPNGFDYDVVLGRVEEIRKQMPNAAEIEAAFKLLMSEEVQNQTPAMLLKYFETDYQRYGSWAYERVMDVVALPGPTYAMGYSMGALSSIYAASFSQIIPRIVLLAPFFESAAPDGLPEYRYLLELAGALDLYAAPQETDTSIVDTSLPASDTAGRMAMAPRHAEWLKNNVAVFTILA